MSNIFCAFVVENQRVTFNYDRQKIIISVNLSAIIESKMHIFAEEVLLCLGKEAGGNDENKKLQAHIEVMM